MFSEMQTLGLPESPHATIENAIKSQIHQLMQDPRLK
jgi:hypothetical protein